MTAAEFTAMALSFPNTETAPHFERVAFKVSEKRIFCTLHEPSGTANLVLTPVDQSVFSEYKKGSIYPVPNKWGLRGWTTFEIKNVPKGLMLDALNVAYQEVIKKKAAKKKR